MTVVEFKGSKKKVITPESALVEILSTKPEKLICISIDEEGNLSFNSTKMTYAEMTWYLELVKLQFLLGVV